MSDGILGPPNGSLAGGPEQPADELSKLGKSKMYLNVANMRTQLLSVLPEQGIDQRDESIEQLRFRQAEKAAKELDRARDLVDPSYATEDA